MAKKEKLYPVLVSRLPEFIQDEYPVFLQFITAYFEWLESESEVAGDGIPVNFLRALIDFKTNRDLSARNDAYIETIMRSIGYTGEREIQINRHFFVRFVRDFYLSRGSEKSYKFLFKLFFNKDVSINYPRVRVAKSSSNEYANKTIIYTRGEQSASSIYKRIVKDESTHYSVSILGLLSRVQTGAERITEYTINGENVLEISIIDPGQDFIPGEKISIDFEGSAFQEYSIKVGELTAPNPGRNFTTNTLIQVSHPNALQSGTYRVKRIASGSISSVSIQDAGTGYRVGDQISPSSTQNGAGFVAEVESVDSLGAITSVLVINQGWRYDSLPKLEVKSKTGTGAKISAVSSNIGSVAQIETLVPFLYDRDASVTNPTVLVVGNGTGATWAVQERSSYQTASRFIDQINGILGRRCVITDSLIYQQFSYELVSDESPESYRDLIQMVHPAGYIRFNVMQLVDKTDSLLGTSLDNLGVLSWKIKRKIAPYRWSGASGLPAGTQTWPDVSWPMLTQVGNAPNQVPSKFTRVKLVRGATKKLTSLSINTIDTLKFSDNLDYLPLDILVPVMDAVNSNQFMNETLEAVITQTTV